ncbi:MAG: sulfite exporter TauE/SafE family protein [Pseudobdellovibrionaceae bacterium]
MLLMGLVGGFSHCTLMCGAFAISLSSSGKTESVLYKLTGMELLPYHAGRTLTYVGMSAVFFSLVNIAFLFMPAREILLVPLLLLAGTIFLTAAFPDLSRIFPWASKIKFNFMPAFLDKTLQKALSLNSFSQKFIAGLILGFMPCGLVVAALMASSAAPTLLEATGSMALFALGTVPALTCVAAGSSFLEKYFIGKFLTLRQSAFLVSAVWLFALAGLLVL